jgi:hypothetical protein
VISELGYPRSELIITTKIFWGDGQHTDHNAQGLSRKHIIEGTKASLSRLGLDYVDVIFAHRPDATVPMAEIVRAFNWVVDKGYAFYWGTSEWSAREIEEAHHEADRLGLMGPCVLAPRSPAARPINMHAGSRSSASTTCSTARGPRASTRRCTASTGWARPSSPRSLAGCSRASTTRARFPRTAGLRSMAT